MDASRISELLRPFFPAESPPPACDSECVLPSPRRAPSEVEGEESAALEFPGTPLACHFGRSEESAVLNPKQLQQISTYIDLLLRWNARVNLSAIRDAESIVTRHFGESLFAARHLFPPDADTNLIDLGSGAGFPGLPIKIWALDLHVTLIESNHKKATFLREVIRTLTLTDIDVFNGRAEDFPASSATVVTLRAVERFESSLPIAARLAASSGRIALLIGASQAASAQRILPDWSWNTSVPIPLSTSRILLAGTKPVKVE